MLVAQSALAADVVPVADHHQHLFSPGIVELLSTPERKCEPFGLLAFGVASAR